MAPGPRAAEPIRPAAPVAPPSAGYQPPERSRPVPPSRASREKSGPPGWLWPVVGAVVVIVVVAVAAVAYLKFFRAAPAPQAVAESSTVAAPASPAPAPSAVAEVAAAASQPAASASAAAPVAAATAGLVPQQVAAAQAPSVPVQQPAATESVQAQPTAQQAAPTVAQEPAAPPPAAPIDHTLKIAADLVQKGERAYAQRNYAKASQHARSALDVHPGYAPAERLLRRAGDAQARVAQRQQQAEQQRLADEQKRKQAEAEAAKPKGPTPDELYNQRAHSECARGFFGKSCRHKVRIAVCQGVKPGSPGSTVCESLDKDD